MNIKSKTAVTAAAQTIKPKHFLTNAIISQNDGISKGEKQKGVYDSIVAYMFYDQVKKVAFTNVVLDLFYNQTKESFDFNNIKFEDYTETEEYKHINSVINTIIAKYNIDWSTGIIKENGMYDLDVSCPCCKYRYPTRKITSKSHFNVYSKNGSFRLRITDIDCNDNDHKEINKKIEKFFAESIPDLEYFKAIKFVDELKRTFKGQTDKRFFKENTQVLVGTGGGKTYQSAMKIIESIIEGKFVIFSTKENSMLHDIEGEIKKIIKENCEQTELIKDLIKENESTLKKLYIYKMISSNGLNPDTLSMYRGIITNHKYFYGIGHKAGINPKFEKIIQYLNTKQDEIIIVLDEFEDYENKGHIYIPLNLWLVESQDINSKAKYIKSNNCFNQKEGSKEKHSPYDWAGRLNKQSSTKNAKGIENYTIDAHGNICLENDLVNCLSLVKNSRYDYGRRVEKKLKTGRAVEFIIAKKYKTIVIDNGKLLIKTERSNIEDLLLNAESVTISESIPMIEGEDINSPKEFNDYAITNNYSDDEYKILKHTVEVEAGQSNIFNKILIIKQKSCLPLINNCKIFRLSANSAKCEIPVNDDLVYKSAEGIKKEIFIWIPRQKDIDTLIHKLHEELEKRDCSNINPLIFYGLKNNLNSYYKKANDVNKFTGTKFITSTVEDEDVTPKTTDKTTEKTVEKYITATYLNGSESQGKNYSNTELLIMNSTPPIDANGRFYWDATINETLCEKIEDASQTKLSQTSGRVDRIARDKKDIVKIIIMVGTGKVDDEQAQEFVKNFVANKNKYPFDTELITYDSIKLTRKDIENVHVTLLLDYIFATLDNENRNLDVIIPNLFDDGRTTNAKKYDDKEIYDFYINKAKEYEEINNKKLKKSELLPDLKEKFGISKATFDRIVSKNVNNNQ